tara:strand:- start:2103 stop:2915 length:813 start_codon:yes stop_codon:yes gene_type:complete
MSNYAVGDIQGCFEEFYEGLEMINFNSSEDFLWLSGDLVNRGPDSLKLLKYIYSIKDSVHIVLGNHDLHFLNIFYNKKKPNKEDTLESLLKDPNVSQFANFLLRQQFIFAKKVLSNNKIIKVGMVHAGIPKNMSLKKAEILSKLISLKLIDNPNKSLKDIFKIKNESKNSLRELVNFFTRVRVIDKKGMPEFSYKGGRKNIPSHLTPWFENKIEAMEDLDYLLFGHWAALEGKTNISNIKALDTGCCWGKELTFLRLEDRKNFVVKSKQK